MVRVVTLDLSQATVANVRNELVAPGEPVSRVYIPEVPGGKRFRLAFGPRAESIPVVAPVQLAHCGCEPHTGGLYAEVPSGSSGLVELVIFSPGGGQ